MTRKRYRPGRGAIVLIVSLFAVSAILRFGTGVGLALAESQNSPPFEAASHPAAEGGDMRAKTPPDAALNRAEIGNLLEALRAREGQVHERERQLQVRQKALEVADQEIRARISELEKVEDRLRQTLALADGAAEGDLARLTTVYENMKGKDAAALFETMDPAFAAGFLGRMRPDAAASVMAGLTPETAYTISVILAGRNANAPKS